MTTFYFDDGVIIEYIKGFVNDGQQCDIERYSFVDECVVYTGKYDVFYYEKSVWNKMKTPLIGNGPKCIKMSGSYYFCIQLEDSPNSKKKE